MPTRGGSHETRSKGSIRNHHRPLTNSLLVAPGMFSAGCREPKRRHCHGKQRCRPGKSLEASLLRRRERSWIGVNISNQPTNGSNSFVMFPRIRQRYWLILLRTLNQIDTRSRNCSSGFVVFGVRFFCHTTIKLPQGGQSDR